MVLRGVAFSGVALDSEEEMMLVVEDGPEADRDFSADLLHPDLGARLDLETLLDLEPRLDLVPVAE